jgi:hypothetical protein
MLRSAVHAVGQFLVARSQPEATPGRSDDDAAAARQMLQQAGDGRLAAGVMQVLGQDQIAARLGERWPQVADRAEREIEAAIQAGLGPDDLVQRREGGSYLLCFPSLDADAAKARVRTIVTDVEARLLEQVPEYGTPALAHAVSEVDCELALSADAADPLSAIAGQLETIRAEVDDAVQRARAYLSEHATLCYRPIWSRDGEMVESYVPRLDDCTGRELFEYLKLVGDPATLAELTGEVDGVILGRAVTALHSALQQGCPARLLLPVNFATLGRSRVREPFLALCRGVPEGYRKQLRFEVYGVPDSVPETRLVDVLQPLRSFADGLVVEVGPDPRGWARVLDKGVAAVALDAASLGDDDLARLGELVRAARSANVEVYLHRVNRRGLGVQAMRWGVQHLDGDAVAQTVGQPNRRYRMRAPFASTRTAPPGWCPAR